VVYNPTSDQYLVTWHAFTNGNWRIYGQRVSPAAQLVAANFLVSASTGVTQNPHVAWNHARNEYLLVWQDLRNGGRVDVYAQRLSAAGALLGGNFAISTASGNKDGCDVAYSDAANDYLVVWGDARSGGNDVYAQRVDATGSLVGADFQIAASSVAETAPVVAYDAVTHGYLVAYWQFDSVSDWDVWSRFVPGTGAPSDPSVAVSTATEVQNWVELTQNRTSGEFLAVWQDFRAGSYNIYGQRLSTQPLTFTPTATNTATITAAATNTPTPTRSTTPSPTPTATLPHVMTPTATLVPTASPSRTETTPPTPSPPTPTGTRTQSPTATTTPGGNACCQCVASCTAPINGSCGECTLIVGAVCRAGALCELQTPTPSPKVTPTATATPGANDCCQCADFCAAPVVGTCGGCTVVSGASCTGGTLCVPPSCVGDCDGSGGVDVTKIIKMVNVALGVAPVTDCAGGDPDGSGTIDVTEIIQAVNNALSGCP